ncbi:unnamed protein product [Larinioides sclopetarius]|uniref:Uncharacterized protein n=1 Tax=Larinioides sclopetarius TaxID=280406 RepID=A0AAV2BHQ2_9ARAC
MSPFGSPALYQLQRLPHPKKTTTLASPVCTDIRTPEVLSTELPGDIRIKSAISVQEYYDTSTEIYTIVLLQCLSTEFLSDIRVKCAISIQGHDDLVWNMSVERIALIIFDINGIRTTCGLDDIRLEQ